MSIDPKLGNNTILTISLDYKMTVIAQAVDIVDDSHPPDVMLHATEL